MMLAPIILGVGFVACCAVSIRGALLDEYQPTQWPTHALHAYALAFAASFAEESGPVFGAAVLALGACALCAASADSYTSGWLLTFEHLANVYQGDSNPFWDTCTRRSFSPKVYATSYEFRYAVAGICSALAFVGFLALMHRFTHDPPARGQKMPRIDAWVLRAAYVLVALDVVFCISPYPRWVAADSPHALLIAGLCMPFVANASARAYWLQWAALFAGCAMSTLALNRTLRETAEVGWLHPVAYRAAFDGGRALGKRHAYVWASAGTSGMFAAASWILHMWEFALVSFSWGVLAHRTIRAWRTS
jgi:hypothetical protein